MEDFSFAGPICLSPYPDTLGNNEPVPATIARARNKAAAQSFPNCV